MQPSSASIISNGRSKVAPSPPENAGLWKTDCEELRTSRLVNCPSEDVEFTKALSSDPSRSQSRQVLSVHDHPEPAQSSTANQNQGKPESSRQLQRTLQSFRMRFDSENIRRRAMWAMLVMLRNACASVSIAWLLTFFCSLGTLSSKPVAQQSYNRFLLATLVWSHFFFCFVVFFTQACFLARRRFLSDPENPPTFFFCLQRLCAQTYYAYLKSLIILLACTLLISRFTPVNVRSYKLEFYIGCFCSHTYTTNAVISTWRIIQQQTVSRLGGVAASRPVASNLGCFASIRQFWRVFFAYSPLATVVVLAGLFVHVISKYRISSQTEMLVVSAASLIFKLLIQECIKMCVIRRNVKDIRTMCVAVGLPTVLIDTQLRIALQRVQSAQLTIAGTALLALVEIAMRVGKVLLVTLEIRREEHKTRSQRVATTMIHQLQEPQSLPSSSPRITRSPRQRRASLTTPDARFRRWKTKLLAFHTAEIYADMSAEYIAIGCSAALLYFYWSHPKYELRLLSMPSPSSFPENTSQEAIATAMPMNQLLLLGLQVGAEMGVDYVASLLEVSAGIDFMELRKYGPFVACVFISVAVINSLISAVIFMRTLQDFPRWADEGKLLNYKPANFSQIYDGFKDAKGAWFGYRILAFSYATNATALGGLPAPASPLEIVDPKYKGLIASSYPHDDDAALFIFASYVEKYGWDWAAKLATQNVVFSRGSDVAGDVVTAGNKSIAVGTGGDLTPAINGKYPFLAWGQRMAILKKAKHPAAAKLLISWIATEDAQRKFGGSGWTIRKDLPTTNGYSQIWEIPEAGMSKFAAFMEDRERIEMWKQTFALYFGEVRGEPTPGVLGLHPGA